jgi:hypothetical protein
LRLETIGVDHLDVEEHDVRPQFADRPLDCGTVGALTDDVEVRSRAEKLADALSREWLIVDDKN